MSGSFSFFFFLLFLSSTSVACFFPFRKSVVDAPARVTSSDARRSQLLFLFTFVEA